MRKIKLFRLSLILGLIFHPGFASAQDGSEIGIIGPMRGRVTNADGKGISNASITVTPTGSCFQWTGSYAQTNPFGYYLVNVHYDCGLIISSSKKGRSFTPSSIFVSIDGTYENVNFIAN